MEWNRRGRQNQCADCGAECRRRRRCFDCQSKINPLASTTLAELRTKYTLNQYHAKVRGNARSVYFRNGKPKECYICGYSLHIDVAHIKDLQEFDVSATLGVVNSVDNLVGLCKNHHWEFDNGYLELDLRVGQDS